jgi:hypothetical protein
MIAIGIQNCLRFNAFLGRLALCPLQKQLLNPLTVLFYSH